MNREEKHPSSKHLAHDLNNIFTRMLTSIELLKRKVNDSSEALSLLNHIEASTYLASEMIEESISKTEKQSVSSRRININSIIQEIIHSFSFQHGNKVEFRTSLESSLNLVSGRYSDFYRIFLNLLTNAVDASKNKALISISSKNMEEEIIIVVEDKGVGISPNDLPSIFTETYSTKNSDKLSGIGLSIVKALVNKYGGTINVESEVGLGTKFSLVFNSSKTKSAFYEQGKTIIIAEDEDILRELLAELLTSYGYNVITFSNGTSVVDYIEANDADLLILDRKMPVMDGFECLKIIGNTNKSIKTILASGSKSDAEQIPLDCKIDCILSKPYNFEELLYMVKELIG